MNEMESEPKQETSHLLRNWFSYLMLAGLILIFFSVDQVNHLFEWPRFETGANDIVGIGLYAYLVGLLLIYLIVGAWVVPFRTTSVCTAAQIRDDSFVSVHQRLLAIVFGIAALILLAGGYLLPELPYVLDSIILFTFFWFCLAATLMFALWPRLASTTRRLLLRSLIALSLLNLLGEVIWVFAHTSELFSPRNYSIWAILHVFFCAFLFARVVDVWQSYSPFPVRGAGILLAVIVFGLSQPTTIGRPRQFDELPFPSLGGDTRDTAKTDNQQATDDAWLAHVMARLEQIPPDGPVILVAASGGGSRAALFTALVYEELERSPIEYTFQGQERSYAPADHILMVSSVSGGTLASSCYLDPTYSSRRAKDGGRSGMKHSIEDEMPVLMRAELDDVRELPWYRRVDPETNETIVDFTELAGDKLRDEALPPWFFRRAFVDDMCTDFMAPLLRGALHPGRDRGENLSKYWVDHFGMRQTNIDWLQHHTSTENGVSPILLCNVCEVERGSRLVIGFPPLPPGFLPDGGRKTVRAWVDLDSRHDTVMELDLSTATRISANFPWGLPVSRIPAPQYDQLGTQSQADVRLIDGGVCDNTGIDSLRYLVEALEHWSQLEAPTTDLDRRRHEMSAAIINGLRERGVILLEIDSGAKPERPGFMARRMSGFLEPIQAIQNASYASALSALDNHVDSVEQSLPNSSSANLTQRILELRAEHSEAQQLNPLEAGNVKRLTITCNHQDNVMTAWALGPRDKAQIFVRFLVGSERLRYELAEYMEEYQTTRAAVEELTLKVEELEQTDASAPDAVTEVITLRNRLVQSSQAAQNLDALRIGSEKAFYRGMTVSKEQLNRLDDRVRTKFLRDTIVPDPPPQTTGPEPDPEVDLPRPSFELESPASAKMSDEYLQLDHRVQEIDRSIKQQRQEAIKGIESLRKRD